MAENNEVKLTAKLDDQVSPAIKKMADNVDTASKKVDQSSTAAASGIDKQARAARKAAEEMDRQAKASVFLANESKKLNDTQEKSVNIQKQINDSIKNASAGFLSYAAIIGTVVTAARALAASFDKVTDAYLNSASASENVKIGFKNAEEQIKANDIIIGRHIITWKELGSVIREANSDMASMPFRDPKNITMVRGRNGMVPVANQMQPDELPPPTQTQMLVSQATNWKKNYKQGDMQGADGPGSRTWAEWRQKAADAAEREAAAQEKIWAKRLGTDKFDMGTYGDARLFRTGQKYRDAAQGDATFNYTPVPGYDYDVSDMKGETARNATLKQQEMIANSYERSREMARRFTSTMLQGLADMDRAGKITFRSLTALLLQLVDVLASGKAADALGGIFQTFASTDPATDASRGRSAGD